MCFMLISFKFVADDLKETEQTAFLVSHSCAQYRHTHECECGNRLITIGRLKAYQLVVTGDVSYPFRGMPKQQLNAT